VESRGKVGEAIGQGRARARQDKNFEAYCTCWTLDSRFLLLSTRHYYYGMLTVSPCDGSLALLSYSTRTTFL
jgi:hypothetical protein